MSETDDDERHVGFRVDGELADQFMLAYRGMQAKGEVPAGGDRSQAMRQLMRAFVNDPSIISKGSSDEEIAESR